MSLIMIVFEKNLSLFVTNSFCLNKCMFTNMRFMGVSSKEKETFLNCSLISLMVLLLKLLAIVFSNFRMVLLRFDYSMTYDVKSQTLEPTHKT
uniref:Uncharacterized protein n=1 Tax=Zygnema circumcarinatum TaxID=35869 RepID=Q32RG5_ZYGCR|nr:hypothetical protein P8547_pgp009 [Zygnema circumcarinatum]AAX45896.1 hypothetical protein [Zygnema circumcarinatum]